MRLKIIAFHGARKNMELLLLFAVTVRLALASDLRELYPSDYGQATSDNSRRDNTEPSGALHDDAKEAGILKYNELRFLLHNERNKANLGHTNNKGTIATIERNIHTGYRNVDGDTSESDNQRKHKRNPNKWLGNLFHQQSIMPRKIKSSVLKHLRQPRDSNVNANFTEALVNLTNTVKMLNENLVGLKNDITNYESYVLIKIPKTIEDNDVSQRPLRSNGTYTEKDKFDKDRENLVKSQIS